MGIGYKMGGTGGELAFRVAAYPTEQALLAAVPPDGTLGIVTEQVITGWSIRGTAPEGPALGHLWIRSGSSSLGAFDALTRDSLIIQPIGAYQWTGEDWADRLGKTFFGGWKDWEPETAYLYRAWDQNEALTGGWFGTDGCLDVNGGTFAVTARLFGGSVSYGAAYTSQPIEVAPWSRVQIQVSDVDVGADSNRFFALFREKPSGTNKDWDGSKPVPNEALAAATLEIGSPGTYFLDLSGMSSGAYYMGVLVRGFGYNQGALTATRILLEKGNAPPGDPVIPEQYGMITYNQDRTITIT